MPIRCYWFYTNESVSVINSGMICVVCLCISSMTRRPDEFANDFTVFGEQNRRISSWEISLFDNHWRREGLEQEAMELKKHVTTPFGLQHVWHVLSHNRMRSRPTGLQSSCQYSQWMDNQTKGLILCLSKGSEQICMYIIQCLCVYQIIS